MNILYKYKHVYHHVSFIVQTVTQLSCMADMEMIWHKNLLEDQVAIKCVISLVAMAVHGFLYNQPQLLRGLKLKKMAKSTAQA